LVAFRTYTIRVLSWILGRSLDLQLASRQVFQEEKWGRYYFSGGFGLMRTDRPPTPESKVNEFIKQCLEQGTRQNFGECPYCNDEITRGDLMDSNVAIELSADPRIWHKDCCPCQTDDQKKEIADKKLWQDLDVRYFDKSIVGYANYYPGTYVGYLQRCPFCFRVFDDDGTEVAI
jgi:hypothetical protein